MRGSRRRKKTKQNKSCEKLLTVSKGLSQQCNSPFFLLCNVIIILSLIQNPRIGYWSFNQFSISIKICFTLIITYVILIPTITNLSSNCNGIIFSCNRSSYTCRNSYTNPWRCSSYNSCNDSRCKTSCLYLLCCHILPCFPLDCS